MLEFVFTGIVVIGSYKLIEVFQHQLGTVLVKKAGIDECRYLDQVRKIIFSKMLLITLPASLPVCAALMYCFYDFSLMSFGFMFVFLAAATYSAVLKIDDKYVGEAFRPESFSIGREFYVTLNVKGELTEEERQVMIEGKDIHSSLFAK
ncbi:hypothetical protein [Vibrio crassostreae]|uniref:hypothetical protein n=1 Tax=Vibrio crassostreae TaxID=246167 RepID=UPI001B312DCF|nr:hypothetical protein [Vibrio crassostreae]